MAMKYFSSVHTTNWNGIKSCQNFTNINGSLSNKVHLCSINTAIPVKVPLLSTNRTTSYYLISSVLTLNSPLRCFNFVLDVLFQVLKATYWNLELNGKIASTLVSIIISSIISTFLSRLLFMEVEEVVGEVKQTMMTKKKKMSMVTMKLTKMVTQKVMKISLQMTKMKRNNQKT